MSSIIKRKRIINGKHVASNLWYVRFMDHDQMRRTLPAFSDKAASQALMLRLEKLVALRLAGEEPDVATTRWLESAPAKIVEKLAQWGVLSRAKVVARKPLADHIYDWQEALRVKKTQGTTICVKVARLKKLFGACGFHIWSDLDAIRINSQISDWQGKGEIAAQTCNHYVQHVKQFCKWMVEHGRASASPVNTLTKRPVLYDRRRARRALISQQFQVFIDAVRKDPSTVHGLEGAARAVLYLVARFTGLRWSEIRPLKRSAFVLDGDKPMIMIKATDEKHPRGFPLPLSKEMAEQLRRYFADYPGDPGDRAFALPSRRVGAEMIRHDLALAGISYEVEGKIFDFHALRGQLATDLARVGVSVQKAQKIMRHSDINLTMKYYTHLNVDELRDAIEQLPPVEP